MSLFICQLRLGQDELNNDEDSIASTKRTHSETVEGDDEREIVKEEADPPKKKRKRKVRLICL